MEKEQIKNFIERLKEQQENGDTEISHSIADDILCELLIDLGYHAVVDEYNKIDKWFA